MEMEMENFKLFPKDTSQSTVTVMSTSWPTPQLQFVPQTIENPPHFIFKMVPNDNVQRQSQKRDADEVPKRVFPVARNPSPHQQHPDGSKFQVLVDEIEKKNWEILGLRKVIFTLESEQKNPRMKVSYLYRQNRTFSANVDKLAAKTEELTKKLREVQAELDQRNADLAAKTKEALEHRQQYDMTSSQLKTELSHLTTKNQELVARFNSKCDELDELLRMFREKCSDCDTLLTKHEKMELLLNEKNCKINYLNRKIEDLNHQLSFENTCCAVFEEKIEKLDSQITLEKLLNESLQEQLTLLREEAIHQDISPKRNEKIDEEMAKMECESTRMLRTALEWKTGQPDICKVTSSSSPTDKDNKRSLFRKRKLVIIRNNGEEQTSVEYKRKN